MQLRPAALLPFSALFALSCAASLHAQQPVTADDYAHAAKFLSGNANRLVSGMVRPAWIGDTNQFWYLKTQPSEAGSDRTQFVLVDAATGAEQPAFDHAKLAAALSTLTGRPLDANALPFPAIEFTPGLHSIIVGVGGKRYVCDRAGTACTLQDPHEADAVRNAALSPDGHRAVFIRDWNLWVRPAKKRSSPTTV
jgi:hypothetical protein